VGLSWRDAMTAARGARALRRGAGDLHRPSRSTRRGGWPRWLPVRPWAGALALVGAISGGLAWMGLQNGWAIYAIAINVTAAVFVILDKALARLGMWRIPERTLLALALAGGSPAAWLAMQAVRHKTSKRSFKLAFLLVALAQAAAGYWFITWS